jgi:hypothetical protein
MKDSPDRLDELLDAGLKSYVGQSPPPGLERRTLNRVHEAPRRWRIWLPAAAVFAAVCFVLVVPRKPPAPARIVPAMAAVTRPPVVVAAVEPKRRHTRAKPPKPQRLSDAERALLSFLGNESNDGRGKVHQVLLAMDRSGPIEELRIEPLAIPEDQIKEKTQ